MADKAITLVSSRVVLTNDTFSVLNLVPGSRSPTTITMLARKIDQHKAATIS